MLKEIKSTRQIPGENARRWFTSDKSDLFVWYNQNREPVGFQLCYDKNKQEKSFIWKSDKTSNHTAIDSGEHTGIHYKQTPIHVADGIPDYIYIRKQFLNESDGLPHEIIEMVIQALSDTNISNV